MYTTQIRSLPSMCLEGFLTFHFVAACILLTGSFPSSLRAQTVSMNDPGSDLVAINLKFTANGWEINTWQDTVSSPEPVLPYLWVALTGRDTVVRIATAVSEQPS